MLEVLHIKKAYDSRVILNDVSFFLPEGFALKIEGQNGCGKSTLFKILTGMEKLDSGEVKLNGKNVLGNKDFLRKTLAYVPQNAMLFSDLTVFEQLKLWLLACGKKEKPEEEILSLMGLESLLKTKIALLSGGQQKRVSIAMALLQKPSILILDEATANLDTTYIEKLYYYLKSFLEKNGSLLYCSHQEDLINQLMGSKVKLDE